MAIKKARKIQILSTKESKPEKTAKAEKSAKKLPSDEYKDEIPAKEIELDEENKIVISVKRMGNLGLPYVDIRLFVDNDRYTGFTKKGISFPIEYLLEVVDSLKEAFDESDEKGLFE